MTYKEVVLESENLWRYFYSKPNRAAANRSYETVWFS